MITFEYQGGQYEFRGEYRHPKAGERFLADNGRVLQNASDSTTWNALRAIVHPVPVEHVYAGLRFLETGEYRRPREGEFLLCYGTPALYRPNHFSGAFRILKPVEVLA